MSLTTSKISLSNPRQQAIEPLVVEVLADTGALHLCITERICHQLDLETLEYREVVLADGTKKRVPYVGPVQIKFANRTGFTGALVLGDEALMGVIPMEDMDLVVIPRSRQLAVNPANPSIAASSA